MKKIVVKINRAGQIRAYSNFSEVELQQKYFARIQKSPKYVRLNKRTKAKRAIKHGLQEFIKRVSFICKTIHIGFSKPEVERRQFTEKVKDSMYY